MATLQFIIKNKSPFLVLSFALFIIGAFVFYSCNGKKDLGAGQSYTSNQNRDKLINEDYVGSESCKSCHEAEYNDWEGSHHDKAMMIADANSVLADFDTTFNNQGVTSRFYKKDDTFFVNTEGADGKYYDYEIVYTYGIEPLQQYIVEFPKGKFQCLRTAWDTEKNLWFDLYPDMQLVHDEWIHWTSGGQNWNIMCSDCHSTLLKKNYNPVKDSYKTDYAIINVSCEACHGPGKEHVEITESEVYKNNPDSIDYIGKLYMGKYTLPKQMVDDCARCHSLRTQYTEYYDHEGDYMDHYAPDLLRDGIYFADGQILGEVYVYASFIQSKMYSLNVKCNDCHNVHSLDLKFEGNELCLQCHEVDQYNVKAHHFHEMNTEASECISCHMPGRIYMGNDFRRDHSFRVPRPDLSARYGVPNTCNTVGCHDDESAEWSALAVKDWYGPERVKHFSDALTFGRTRVPEAIPGLIELATDKTQPGIARSTAVMYLGETVAPEAFQTITSLLNDNDPLVRYTSARIIDVLSPQDRAQLLAPMLVDNVRTVRIAALGSLVGVPKNLMSNLDQANYDNVFKEYWTGVQLRSDFPGGQMEIAQYYEKTGNPSLAEQAYVRAIEIDSYYNPARINLAGMYYNQERFKEAEELFKKVIELEPAFGQAYYSLGLLFAEQNNMLEAAKYLEQATDKIDYNDRVPYNYGLILQRLGKREDAELAFKTGLKINPNSTSNLYALSYLYVEQNRFKEATPVMKKLLVLDPNNQQYVQLNNAVQQGLGKK